MAKIWRDGVWITVYHSLSDEVSNLEKEAKSLAKDDRCIKRNQVTSLAERVAMERTAGNITGKEHMNLDVRLEALWPDS